MPGFNSGGAWPACRLHLVHALTELRGVGLGLDLLQALAHHGLRPAGQGARWPGSSGPLRGSFRRNTPTVRFSLVRYFCATRWMSAAVTASAFSAALLMYRQSPRPS